MSHGYGKPVVVEQDAEEPLYSGDVIRFGARELWVVERASLHPKSALAGAAVRRAHGYEIEDPVDVREFTVHTPQCHWAIQRCKSWTSLVQVVLEYLKEPDEPPCVDYIEVKDERGQVVSTHTAVTLEEAVAYDVKLITRDIRKGCVIHIRLSSDPCYIAPLLDMLDRQETELEEKMANRTSIG